MTFTVSNKALSEVIGADAFADCAEGIVLYGPENSTVSKYAQSSGLLFEPIHSLVE